MIARLKGILVEKDLETIIVDVSGVGYEVYISLKAMEKLPPLNETVELSIYTHVREDAFLLFGFIEKIEKQLFETLISVSGIGAKSAMGILSNEDPASFVDKILNDDKVGLTNIPGIGKKTAERLILELREKVKMLNVGSMPQQSSGKAKVSGSRARDSKLLDAMAALMGLGYKENISHDIALGIINKLGDNASIEDIIKEALRSLSNQGR